MTFVDVIPYVQDEQLILIFIITKKVASHTVSQCRMYTQMLKGQVNDAKGNNGYNTKSRNIQEIVYTY